MKRKAASGKRKASGKLIVKDRTPGLIFQTPSEKLLAIVQKASAQSCSGEKWQKASAKLLLAQKSQKSWSTDRQVL